MKDKLYQARKGGVTCGFIVRDGKIVKTCPYLNKIKGLSIITVLPELKRWGWTVEEVKYPK